MAFAASPSAACLRIRVRGEVQGVGFRPFVHRLAHELGLAGWVRNDGQGVDIEVQGPADALDALVVRLRDEAPVLARVTRVEAQPAPVRPRAGAFVIGRSVAGAVATGVTPDSAVCPDCLRELFTPADRRWRYPFINCTNCGPRYTITRALPYDRPQTSMAPFALCPECAREYDDPADRRFHAQPNACPACGPRLTLCDSQGAALACEDPIAETIALLRSGRIVAIKGLGGFHLACDATNAHAVATLRRRKNREEKPFALMVCNAGAAEAFAECPAQAKALLESPERPVVLLRKRAHCDAALHGVAPGLAWLGVMLPYTPLHYLLFHEAAGRPPGNAWLATRQPITLVMTSANPGGEPIVRGNGEAGERLSGIADAILLHDRDIVTRCDDSVVRVEADGAPRFIRRARGYTPRAIRLARAGPSVLALGGFLKNTVCLTRGDEAFVSQHVGDLDNAATCEALDETVERLMALLQIRPEVVAHDLHPDFYGTAFAADLAQRHGLPRVAVQHHHAHVAAVAAEHRVVAPVIGLALDGVGLGSDGHAWGGELLRVDGARFERLGHLRALRLPGGDRAAREPWRMAAAALHAMGRGDEIARRFPRAEAATLARMLASGVNAPETSSCGRWFDAAAGLLGVREFAAFEGQAAMLLEGCAERYPETAALPDGFVIEDGVLDLRPLLAWIADQSDVARAAACFHATLAAGLAQWASQAARAGGIRRVALAGGCFLNRILATRVRAHLEGQGLDVLEAQAVPPNDGGLSLGQAWVALQGGET